MDDFKDPISLRLRSSSRYHLFAGEVKKQEAIELLKSHLRPTSQLIVFFFVCLLFVKW